MYFADVCCLQESKLENISATTWREIGGPRLDKFAFIPSVGASGGIIIGLNSVLLKGEVVFRGKFCMSVDFLSIKDNFAWCCTSVYGPNARSLKSDFWEELRGCGVSPTVPWVLCGDFNAIFSLEDKTKGEPNLADICSANSLLQDLCLFEPPAVGRRFTWTNGQADPIWVKLDRFVVNSAFSSRFPRLIQNCLPRLGSDHVPIRLEGGMHCASPRLFRFELAWTKVEGFPD